MLLSGITMSFETRISRCKKYIQVTPGSTVTYELAVDFTEKAFFDAMQHGIRNYFFDMRGVRNTASTEHNYQLINNSTQRTGCDKTAKIGILADPHDDSYDFVKVAANSIGLKCKIFTSEDSLLEWIRI